MENSHPPLWSDWSKMALSAASPWCFLMHWNQKAPQPPLLLAGSPGSSESYWRSHAVIGELSPLGATLLGTALPLPMLWFLLAWHLRRTNFNWLMLWSQKNGKMMAADQMTGLYLCLESHLFCCHFHVKVEGKCVLTNLHVLSMNLAKKVKNSLREISNQADCHHSQKGIKTFKGFRMDALQWDTTKWCVILCPKKPFSKQWTIILHKNKETIEKHSSACVVWLSCKWVNTDDTCLHKIHSDHHTPHKHTWSCQRKCWPNIPKNFDTK